MQFDTVTNYTTDFTPPVIAVAGGDDFTSIVMGSGVIIAPYLALTARHVIDQGLLKHSVATVYSTEMEPSRFLSI